MAVLQVKVEKYLTAEQRKEQERREKEEEERRIRERGDNARERGLDMMMGGVLEIKKEDELKKVSQGQGRGLRGGVINRCGVRFRYRMGVIKKALSKLA